MKQKKQTTEQPEIEAFSETEKEELKKFIVNTLIKELSTNFQLRRQIRKLLL